MVFVIFFAGIRMAVHVNFFSSLGCPFLGASLSSSFPPNFFPVPSYLNELLVFAHTLSKEQTYVSFKNSGYRRQGKRRRRAEIWNKNISRMCLVGVTHIHSILLLLKISQTHTPNESMKEKETNMLSHELERESAFFFFPLK